MAQPYVYAHPPGTAPRPPQGGGVPGVIVDPRFCDPESSVKLWMSRGDYEKGPYLILDSNTDTMFKVKEPFISLRKKMILLDKNGSSVLTMRKKIVTLHERWEVFKGGSTEECDLMYTVKKSSMFDSSTELDSLQVFMVNNDEETICDFGVKGWYKAYYAYAGESKAIVAQMKHEPQTTAPSVELFSVTVNPNVDYAFIASLAVLFDVSYRVDPPTTNARHTQEVVHGAHTLVHVLHQLLH